MIENKPKLVGRTWGGKLLTDTSTSNSHVPIDNNKGTRIYQWKDGFTTTVIYGEGQTTITDWSNR